ncbi:TPA: hypothetical protein ACX6RR_002724 [Photobacterium damselae]
MSNVLKFPVQEPRREPTELEKMVEQELVDLGADVEMARIITQRMERFLELAAFEFDMRMKVSKECLDEMNQNVFPVISEMQASVQETMSEILTERVMHEIQLYNLELKAGR